MFDIQQGVAISVHTKLPHPAMSQRVFRADLLGERIVKYQKLSQTSLRDTAWETVHAAAPFYLFSIQNVELRDEYGAFASLVSAMPTNSVGVVTGRDAFAIDSSPKDLEKRVAIFCDAAKSDEEIRELFGIRDAGGYQLAKRRKSVIGKNAKNFIKRLTYRPFDLRWIAYSRGFLTSDQHKVMQHLLNQKSVAMISARSNKSGTMDHFFCTRNISETKCGESTTQSCVFPLYTFSNDELGFGEGRRPNLSIDFLGALSAHLHLSQDEPDALPHGLTPEDIFHYAYAVFHSPGYRNRYAEFLKIDFPRLPLTENLTLFHALARLGGEITALHLLESRELDKPITTYVGKSREVKKVGWTADNGGTVWINAAGTKAATTAGTSGFSGVPENVWNFHIGGYQVCEKWLKDRKGRTLSDEDIAHYHKVVVALSETIRLMAEIDSVIDQHGGWPGAFVTDPPETEEEAATSDRQLPFE